MFPWETELLKKSGFVGFLLIKNSGPMRNWAIEKERSRGFLLINQRGPVGNCAFKEERSRGFFAHPEEWSRGKLGY